MPIIESGDPDIDLEALNRRIEAQINSRRQHRAYPPMAIKEGHDFLYPLDESTANSSRAVTALPGLNDQLVDLMMHAGLQEPSFTSDIPVVGPIIVRLRYLWNWMSTKWYVLPLIRAQSDFNSRCSVLLSALAQWQEIHAQEVAELCARIDELECRLHIHDKDDV